MGGDSVRLAENEATYRDINERIEAGHELAGDAEDAAFLCECGRLGCNTVLDLSVPEYERIRADPRWFVLAYGHENPEVERVVRTEPGYVVVEKVGDAGEAAEARDPRADDD